MAIDPALTLCPSRNPNTKAGEQNKVNRSSRFHNFAKFPAMAKTHAHPSNLSQNIGSLRHIGAPPVRTSPRRWSHLCRLLNIGFRNIFNEPNFGDIGKTRQPKQRSPTLPPFRLQLPSNGCPFGRTKCIACEVLQSFALSSKSFTTPGVSRHFRRIGLAVWFQSLTPKSWTQSGWRICFGPFFSLAPFFGGGGGGCGFSVFP